VEEQQPEILAVVAQGAVVVVTARERGRYRATGRSYDLHWVQLFTFRQGKVVRVREVFDSAAMLAAVTP
jgi:ketosteroid isomerase-like protein